MKSSLHIVLVACLLALAGCAKRSTHRSNTPAAPAPRQTGPFQAETVQGLGDPEIVIVNKTDLVITIVLTGTSGKTITLQPMATQRQQLPRGAYTYTATAPGVGGTSGNHVFDPDHRYTWTFMVGSSKSPPPGAR